MALWPEPPDGVRPLPLDAIARAVAAFAPEGLAPWEWGYLD